YQQNGRKQPQLNSSYRGHSLLSLVIAGPPQRPHHDCVAKLLHRRDRMLPELPGCSAHKIDGAWLKLDGQNLVAADLFGPDTAVFSESHPARCVERNAD